MKAKGMASIAKKLKADRFNLNNFLGSGIALHFFSFLNDGQRPPLAGQLADNTTKPIQS